MKRRRSRLVLRGVVLLAILAFVVVRWVFVPYRIHGSSMEPTLQGALPERGSGQGGERRAGDIVVVSRLAYFFGSPGRFDVVVIDREVGHESVKRLVGLPGEIIELRNGRLFVDGQAVELPGALAREPLVSKGPFGRQPVALATDEVFVLGDAGYLSEDSRAWGAVPLSGIKGRVVWRLAPWSAFGSVR